MKPVLILQNMSFDGPAFLAQWLREQGVPFDVRNAEAGHSFPTDLSDHGALALLGGEMSANDRLPSLRQAEHLILRAMDQGLPVVGHCLGGQLMARALGARVIDSPAPEIGWQPMQVLDTPQAREWLGAPGERVVCHWHYEAFELPAGAELLATSAACPHQAFAIGPHLAMQFHVEVDAAKLGEWAEDGGERYLAVLGRHASVQSPEQMRAGLLAHLAAQQALARRIYGRWVQAAVARA